MGIERARVTIAGGVSIIGSIAALRSTMIDCGSARAVDPEVTSPEPARIGIEIHTKANPNTSAISAAMKMLREFRREFWPEERSGRFIDKKQSFPVAIIPATNQPAPDNGWKCTLRRGGATIRSL